MLQTERSHGRKPPKTALTMEVVGFALVALIAADEHWRSADAHLWIGIFLGLSAIAGAYLLHNRLS
jgi:hypothetical protein